MSFSSLLSDRCDIYHLKMREPDSHGGYGVPVEDRQREYYYDDVPDVEGVKCYIVENNQTVVQQEPAAVIIQTYTGYFPIDTDIHINSKVVWDGIELRARKPKKVKNHHKEVTLFRDELL